MCEIQTELDLNLEKLSNKRTPPQLSKKEKVRVSANLDPDFTNSMYMENYQKKFEDCHSKRLRKHELRKKLTLGYLDLIRPIPVEDHTIVTQCFHNVINMVYPMVEIEKEEN